MSTIPTISDSQVGHPEVTKELTHEHSTPVGIPDDGHQSGNEENDPNPITHSPSTNSPEIPTTPLPDSIALPGQELTEEELEKRTLEIEQTITRKDYIKYEYLLEEKTTNPAETVDFTGVKAYLMTVQYNLKQFEQPEWRRQFMSREEVHKKFAKFGCW